MDRQAVQKTDETKGEKNNTESFEWRRVGKKKITKEVPVEEVNALATSQEATMGRQYQKEPDGKKPEKTNGFDVLSQLDGDEWNKEKPETSTNQELRAKEHGDSGIPLDPANDEFNEKVRICVIWDSSLLNVTVVKKHAQFIHCWVEVIRSSMGFFCTMVYGSNHSRERDDMWEELIGLAPRTNKAWLAMGDYNNILRIEDRLGGNPVNLADVQGMRRCLEECSM
ncbi:OLC1v1019796C1 [Oldenlandia corymbosa var. corymbosa]|uniref:OLC1v1019796C1 n=1 Tax=Oldenlandia corymbosa var. corymbosa TaxID=529605 RepID=A0AAV1EF30_OLDCO|nr:OLC1v1019796C1 [Oldenlandia corymbosa var. corymbosa]